MLGQIIRDYRLRSGLTLAELATSDGIRRESLSRIEAGKQQIGIGTFLTLSDLLMIPATEWVANWVEEETRLPPLLRVARHLLDREDFSNARLVLRRARTIARHQRHHLRGEVYHQWGRYTYKIGEYGRALHWLRRSEQASLRSVSTVDRAVASLNAALALAKTHFVYEALMKFSHSAATFEKTEHRTEAGYAHLHKANMLRDLGSFREALTEYRRAAVALRKSPWLFEGRLGEAICIGQVRSAESALRFALQLEHLASDANRRANFHHNVAVFYRQSGRLQQALKHLSLALESEGTDTSAIAASLAEMCLCQTHLNDRMGAVLSLQRYHALEGKKDQQDKWTMSALSVVLTGTGISNDCTRSLRDDHEGRLTAAWTLLLSSPRGR